jgi:broad specificity phosphatase PhoE
MTKRVIYLVRHGQYDSKRPSDQLEGSLTAAGKKQARLTARRLSDLPIDVIHHSDLRRAAETAAIIAEQFPGVPLRAAHLLRECIPSVPPRYTQHAYFAGVAAEDLARQRRQVERAFLRYFKMARGADRHEIIVCHGNVIRYFVSRVLGAPTEAWTNMDVYHCGITEVALEPWWTRLVSHNDIGHLPRALKTFV